MPALLSAARADVLALAMVSILNFAPTTDGVYF